MGKALTNRNLGYLGICVMAFVGLCTAQNAKQNTKQKDEHRTVTQVLDRSVTNTEHEFTSAAEAMPEDKFDFAPTNGEFKGVRTFGEQIKHVAAVNYMFGAAILSEKVPVDVGDESGPASVKTKGEILTYLKDSFAYVHKAVETVNEKNLVDPLKSPFGEGSVTRLGLATSVAAHGFDHYGQMVEYLRLNGIVPPASR
ncbi:MAG TPA: DinB family protein [Candidatus Polarisedimenticolia bacterium]|nr:DinB family protein [Candidatus Polarisedimenticolia bacterium]